jgi:Periplasmic copper-binding protein (NosD)
MKRNQENEYRAKENQMSHKMSHGLLLSALALGLALGAAPARAATPVNFGDTISTPGVYYLNGNSSGSGTGITVNADNVTLLLKGHTLTGPGAEIESTGIAVKSNAQGVRIVGPGLVTRFGVGIFVADHAHGNIVTGVRASGNGLGIYFNPNSTNNLVLGNQANDNLNDGILFYLGCTGNRVAFNIANGNFIGIDLLASGNTGNRVEFNIADSNVVLGIAIDGGSKQNTVQYNRALGNGVQDLRDDNGECESNRWQFNRFGTSNPSCIE